MKWIDMTDALFCRAFDHLFMIDKTPKLGAHDWYVFKDSNVIFQGTTRYVGAAKSICKEIYKDIKAAQPKVLKYNTKTGKIRMQR